jgi:hypothetical protein
MDMAGPASWPTAKAIGHKHFLSVSESIAHPLKLPFPYIIDQIFFEFFGYPLRIYARSDPELNTSVNGRSRILTGNKDKPVLGWVAGRARFRGNVETSSQGRRRRFRGNVG